MPEEAFENIEFALDNYLKEYNPKEYIKKYGSWAQKRMLEEQKDKP